VPVDVPLGGLSGGAVRALEWLGVDFEVVAKDNIVSEVRLRCVGRLGGGRGAYLWEELESKVLLQLGQRQVIVLLVGECVTSALLGSGGGSVCNDGE